jgi:F-type H+-transporting ATPase subunit b
MEILKTFGLDWQLLAAQIINFLIILYVLKRFLYPPLFKVFKKREELVRESLQKSEESEKLLEQTKEQEKEIIKKAKTTADQLIKESREQAVDIVKKAEEDAKQKADKMLKDAKEQIALETNDAKKQLNKYVMKLSIEILEKTLSNVLTEKEQSEIVAKAMKEIQKLPN